MRDSFTQVAGDNALYPLVDFNDSPAGASVQHYADREAKKYRRKQTKCDRPFNDVRDLRDIIDVSSDQKQVTVRQPSRDQADSLFFPATFVSPVDRSVLYRVVGFKIWRQVFQIARNPAAIWSKQSREPKAARILLQIVVDRVEPTIGRQARKEAALRGDHTVGTHRQVIAYFQIDEAKQCNDKGRKSRGHQYRPP
ncbi:hypothetical protein CP49_09975 [Bradyrhizobium valentinum]|uniref:Uncharacterized protein n=1 Tax=Bradyrhizobium valentinum TaxID=1518501 RepID=A0A0R3LCV5_9BRAD|nr:hypothetical protein CP49_09975 [Bradyrhizobium valentinum]